MDFYQVVKPAGWETGRCFAPITLSVLDGQVIAMADGTECSGTLLLKKFGLDGRLLGEERLSFSVQDGERKVLSVIDDGSVIFAELEGISESRRQILPCEPKDLCLCQPHLLVTWNRNGINLLVNGLAIDLVLWDESDIDLLYWRPMSLCDEGYWIPCSRKPANLVARSLGHRRIPIVWQES